MGISPRAPWQKRTTPPKHDGPSWQIQGSQQTTEPRSKKPGPTFHESSWLVNDGILTMVYEIIPIYNWVGT